MSARFRRVAVAGAAVAAAIAAMLMPASPAHAATDGTGWSSSWSYTSDTTLQFRATLPGGAIGGSGTDDNGTRTGFAIYVQDTQYDGVCIRGYAVKSPGVVFDVTACDGQTQWFYPADFSGWWSYQIFRVRPDGGIINGHTTSVPDSWRDPGVRHSGNGVDWFYTAPSVALFYLTRDGVQFSGRSDTNGSARSVSGTIIRTPSSEWAQGTLSDGLTTSSAYVHSPNWWADTPLRDFHQVINMRACAQSGCVDGNIPQLT